MEIRIDKWLWTMRLFKTRSIAAEAVKKGHVAIDNQTVKPSKNVKVGDIIELKKTPAIHTYRILQISNNRLNAKLVPNYMEDITTPEQIELIEMGKIAAKMNRARGTGRPTKRERRDLDAFFES